MSAFTNAPGTTSQAFAIAGPSGPSFQSDPYTSAVNILDGILGLPIPMRVGWAVWPNDAVSLYQLGVILNPPTFQGDPIACLISPV